MPHTHAPAARLAHAPRRVTAYQRREPERTVLYDVLSEHVESFLALTNTGDVGGLPRFVQRELRGFLNCGVLAKGFARFRCTACGLDRLVAFSCRGRGFCPSCAGKRMTQLAAHIVDHVIPVVPTRQYVLALPWQLRKRLAYDHAAQKAVLRIYWDALSAFYAQRAKERGILNARTGAVTFVQRFGSSLNLHLHLHTHVIDGVFTERADGALDFHALRPPTQTELRVLVSVIRHEVLLLAVKLGLLYNDDLPDLDDPLLATFGAASAQHVRAVGPHAGQPVQRLLHVDPRTITRPTSKSRFTVDYDGFNLNAGITVRARRRNVLERVLRYCLRPPLSHDRLTRLPDGRIQLAFKTPWSDGTSHMVFEPLEFIARLTALIPRPHKNLVVYHGVLAARSEWRRRVVVYLRPKSPAPALPAASAHTAPIACNSTAAPAVVRRLRHHNYAWAAIMRRAFELDVLACPRCAGRLQLLACVTQPRAIRAILRHLALPADAPAPQPARAPPWARAADGTEVHDHDQYDAIDDDPDRVA